MASPTEIARALFRIAEHIDAESQPSRSRTVAALKKIIAAAASEVTVDSCTHSGFDQSDKECSAGADEQCAYFTCTATCSGSWAKKPFELQYTLPIMVTYGLDADDDGLSSYMNSRPDEVDFSTATLKLGGAQLAGTELAGAVESITNDDGFIAASKSVEEDAAAEAENSDAVADWLSALKDQADFQQDPYRYHGVRRNDFM